MKVKAPARNNPLGQNEKALREAVGYRRPASWPKAPVLLFPGRALPSLKPAQIAPR